VWLNVVRGRATCGALVRETSYLDGQVSARPPSPALPDDPS